MLLYKQLAFIHKKNINTPLYQKENIIYINRLYKFLSTVNMQKKINKKKAIYDAVCVSLGRRWDRVKSPEQKAIDRYKKHCKRTGRKMNLAKRIREIILAVFAPSHDSHWSKDLLLYERAKAKHYIQKWSAVRNFCEDKLNVLGIKPQDGVCGQTIAELQEQIQTQDDLLGSVTELEEERA